jgi:hypothetical protein
MMFSDIVAAVTIATKLLLETASRSALVLALQDAVAIAARHRESEQVLRRAVAAALTDMAAGRIDDAERRLRGAVETRPRRNAVRASRLW